MLGILPRNTQMHLFSAGRGNSRVQTFSNRAKLPVVAQLFMSIALSFPVLASAQSSDENGFSSTTAKCAIEAYEVYAKAGERLDTATVEIIATQDPKLRPELEQRLTLLKAQNEVRRYQLQWLADQKPEQLQLLKGLGGIAYYNWSKQYESLLQSGTPEYATVSSRFEQLKRNERSASDRLHEVSARVLPESSAYSGLTEVFAREAKTQTDKLNTCLLLKKQKARSLTE